MHWIYILAFVISMGVAIGACWVAYQAVTTYDTKFHKNYLYYLLAFYGFATYGIWGQMAFRGLLEVSETPSEFLDTAANFPTILSIPFLLLSWGMLLKMGHGLVNGSPSRRYMFWHFVFLSGVVLGVWLLFYLASSQQYQGKPGVLQLGIGLLLVLELGYLSLFAGRIFAGLDAYKDPKKPFLRRFVWWMCLGWLLRAATLPWLSGDQWISPLLVVLFYLSNGVQVIYLRYYGDMLFTPVFAGSPSEEKKRLLYDTYQLTPREREIVEQLCEGKTNQQIADALFISLQTVKDHTHRIYSKIGIHSRLKLVQMVNG